MDVIEMTLMNKRPCNVFQIPPVSSSSGHKAEDWCMKIHTLEATSPDQHFPVSHTCFFSMEWPRYSSFDIARTKLLYAIVNCTDMDMDATAEGRANLAMSTEDD